MENIKKLGGIVFSVLIYLCLLIPSEAESSAGKYSLNLDDSIKTALRNNKSIQMQEAQVKDAMAQKQYAVSNFLPKAYANFGYTHNEASYMSDPLPGHRKDTRIFQGYDNDNLLTITAQQDIFNGGADIYTFKQSNVNLMTQKETLKATRLEIEYDVKQYFYGLLLAYETERVAKNLLEQAEAHYLDVKAKFDQGTSSRFDVLQSKVQVSTILPQLITAQNQIQLIMADFKKVLYLDMRDDVKIEGKLECSPIPIEESEFLSEAYKKRPEMKLKILGVDLEKWDIELAKSTGLPQVSGSFEYSARSDDISNMINKRHDNWNAGIQVSLAIFDGLSTASKINQARAKYAHARLDKEDYINQIAVDVKQACLNLQEAQAVIEAEKESVDEAREALRLSEVRYDNGVGINLDVLDSQVALAQVEQSLADAMYNYLMAKADLDRIMGKEFSGKE